MSAVHFDIKLKRANKIYHEGEVLSGCVTFNCASETKHDGITLTLEGVVNLQLSTKNAAIFDAFYNSVKPITLLNSALELAPSGKLSAGLSQFHFEFPLVCQREPRVIYETYHGVFINCEYQVRCEVKRSFLAKALQKTQQFCIQNKPTQINQKTPADTSNGITFSISPETLQKSSKERIAVPRFLITGRLDRTTCCVTQPLTGNLTVEHTEVAIKSVELQLLRVETCGCDEGFSKDATEIQTIQMADGNVCPKLDIPLYMVLPRLFTCPTLITKNFKIEFELNLNIIFKDDFIVTENFQVTFVRKVVPGDTKAANRIG